MKTNIPELILELIEKKSFNELTDEEKATVIGSMTEDVYESYHAAVVSSKLFLSHDFSGKYPDMDLKNSILDEFDRKIHKKSIILYRVFLYKMPVYQAGIAALVAILLVYFLTLISAEKPNRFITRTDTVYIKVPVPEMGIENHDIAPVKQEKTTLQRKSERKLVINNEVSGAYYMSLINNVSNKIKLSKSMKSGRALHEDSIAYKLLVAAN